MRVPDTGDTPEELLRYHLTNRKGGTLLLISFLSAISDSSQRQPPTPAVYGIWTVPESSTKQASRLASPPSALLCPQPLSTVVMFVRLPDFGFLYTRGQSSV